MGEDIAALTVGTSGAIRFITDHPQLHPDMETFCYVLDQSHWVVGGATSNGAGIFDWASQTLMQEVTQQAIAQGDNPYDALLSAIAFVPAARQRLTFPTLFIRRKERHYGMQRLLEAFRSPTAPHRKRNDAGNLRGNLFST